MADISVIVPFHNAAATLERCVRALLGQKDVTLEIILVDDASTDDGPAIATALAHGLSVQARAQLRLIRLEHNVGPGAARNAGMAEAGGDYIGFADADDMCADDMFATLLSAARDTDADMAVCGMDCVRDGTHQPICPQTSFTALELLFGAELLAPPWNKIYRTAFVREHELRFPVSRMSEDMAFAFRALLLQPRLAFVPQPLYTYVRTPSSSTMRMALRKESIISLADAKRALRQAGAAPMFRRAYRKYAFLHLLYYPLCLFWIDAMWKGHGRWQTLAQTPDYCRALLTALIRGDV